MPAGTGTTPKRRPPFRGPISRVLVIGRIAAWPRDGRGVPDADRVQFASIEEIGPELLLEARPDMVISSLFGSGWDAVEVASALARSGYEGRYRALTPSLPDLSIVRREVRRVARSLDFDVIVSSDRPEHVS